MYNNQYPQSPQMNTDPNQDPYTLSNPFFNKTQFREMLKSMSDDQRESFEKTLSPEFLNSDRMPSMKEKSTMVILSVLPLVILGLSIDRLYAGRIWTGLLKLLLPLIGIILIVAGILSIASDPTGTLGLILVIIGALSMVGSSVWIVVDVIRSATGKQVDKYGRKIDL